MTTTEYQTHERCAQTMESVVKMAAELNDPTSEWCQQFYDAEIGVTPTPVWQLPETSNGHTLFVKDETSHAVTIGDEVFDVGAFKRRGAWAAALVAGTDVDVLTAASAGNHAQGVAAAAALLGKRSEIFCRRGISSVKYDRNVALGAAVYDDYETLEDAMIDAELRNGLGDDGLVRANIRPFDQAEVIAGQATMVAEWLDSLEALQTDGEIDLLRDSLTVVVPVGGGGLIAGWAVGLELARSQGRIGDNVRLVGAQMHRCDAMNRALQLGESYDGTAVIRSDELNDRSDGTAVTRPGSITLDIARQYVDEMVVLSPAELGEGMQALSSMLSKDVEPAGALAYAAAQKLMAAQTPDGSCRSLFTCVASGANVSSETKLYFDDQVKIAAAQNRFRAASADALRKNDAYHRLMASAVDLDRKSCTTSLGASPTWQFRAKPHQERATYLASQRP